MTSKKPKQVLICFLLCLITASAAAGPDDAKVWDKYQKAAALFKQNAKTSEVISLCLDARKAGGDPVLQARVAFLLSEAYFKTDRPRDARKVLREVYEARDMPGELADEARMRLAHGYLQENKIDKAIQLFTDVALEHNSYFMKQEARLALAWEAADRQDWGASDSLLSRLAEDNSGYQNDPRYLVLKARQAMAMDQPQEAVTLLTDRSGQLALETLARAHEQAGDLIMAVGVYKKIHHSFKAPEALLQAAEVFMRAGDWLAAQGELERFVTDYPQGEYAVLAHFRLGWVHLQLDQIEEALVQYRYNAPPALKSYFKYMEAEALRRLGVENPRQLHNAIGLFSDIAAIDMQAPIAPLAQVRAALTEMQLGDAQDSAIRLRQFLTMYPKDNLEPVVKLLLAINQGNGLQAKYLQSIIDSHGSSEVFDAAFAALQKQDFDQGLYQEVVNRSSLARAIPENERPNEWQRISNYLLAESAYFLRHYELARKYYAQAADGQADNLGERAELGQTWSQLQVGEIDSAIAGFTSLTKRLTGQNHFLASYGLATAYFTVGRFSQALKHYPTSFALESDSTFLPVLIKSLYRIGESHYRMEKYAEAISGWQRVVSEHPNSDLAPSAQYQVAETYFRASHFSDAEAAYDHLLTSYADSPFEKESMLRRAQCAYNAGAYESAVERFEAFIASYPNDENSKSALEGIQLCYFQIGQSGDASDAFERVIERFPDGDLAGDARLRLAMNHLQAGNHAEADPVFKEILTRHPNSSYAMDAQFALAKSLLAQEDYGAAQQELQQFVEYFPTSHQVPEATYLIGVGLYNVKNYLSAIDYFTTVIEKYGESEYYPSALQNIARSFEQINRLNVALRYFQTYLTEFPKAENALETELAMAVLHAEMESYDAALSGFQALQKAKSPAIVAEASYRAGMINVDREAPQEAIVAFESAAANGPTQNYYRLSALAQLGAIHENNGDWQKAINTYRDLANSTTEERWVNAALDRISEISPKLTGN